MIRTQIQLTEAQSGALRQLALTRRVSIAELIRQSVDRLIAESEHPAAAERWDRSLAAAGRLRSIEGDLAVEHDRYLAEAFRQ